MASYMPKPLDAFGWQGCHIKDDNLVLDNGETYTLRELHYLRWELNSWRRIAHALQRDLDKTGMENAVVFDPDELRQIRAILKLLNGKLPGLRMQDVA